MRIKISNDNRVITIWWKGQVEETQAKHLYDAFQKQGMTGEWNIGKAVLKCQLNPRGRNLQDWLDVMQGIQVEISLCRRHGHWYASIGNYRSRRPSRTPIGALGQAYWLWTARDRDMGDTCTYFRLIHLMRKYKIMKVGNKKWEELAHGRST